MLILFLAHATQPVQTTTMVSIVPGDVKSAVLLGSLPIFFFISVLLSALLIRFIMENSILELALKFARTAAMEIH
jgi:hypothetical protein